MATKLSVEIQGRIAGLKVAQARTRERVRVIGVVALSSILVMGGVSPFINTAPRPASAYGVREIPRTRVITRVEVKKVPKYIHRVKLAELEHGWRITGHNCTWSGVTLDCGAMRSYQHISRLIGYPIPVVSDFRTYDEQRALYLAKPGIAAPPGQSLHERGLAIDLAGDAVNVGLIERLLYEHGWRQFSPSGEPWHWSYLITG